MIKISILYPNKENTRFDMDYYLNNHMPMSIGLLSRYAGFDSVSVERGLGGGAPNQAPSYIAMCHYCFESLEDFMAAYMENSVALQADMANYTDIEAIIQVSEVAISR
jgi:uncharacterized protein (TIGR02118 family)